MTQFRTGSTRRPLGPKSDRLQEVASQPIVFEEEAPSIGSCMHQWVSVGAWQWCGGGAVGQKANMYAT